jgi:hypothetical protein
LLLPRGGIAPAARRRSRLALTLAEREDISRGIASGWPLREIARRLDRAASPVSREITGHGGHPAYRAHDADSQAWEAGLRPKRCLLAVNRKLRNIVASKLSWQALPDRSVLELVCREPDWPGYNAIYSATVKAKPQSMIGARTGCPGVTLSTSFPLLITAVPFTSTYTMPSLGVVGFS